AQSVKITPRKPDFNSLLLILDLQGIERRVTRALDWNRPRALRGMGSFDALTKAEQGPIATQNFHYLKEPRTGRAAGEGHTNRLGELTHLHPLLLNKSLEAEF